MNKLSRTVLVSLGVAATLSMALCALPYLIAPATVDGFTGLLPKSGGTHRVLTWLNMSYPIGLVGYSFAAMPVVAILAARIYRLNPVLVMTATVWLELSFVFELVNNLPLVAGFLMPPTAQPVGLSDEALTYLAQTDMLSYLSLDVPGFMLAYAGLGIIAALVHSHSRTLTRVTAMSFALLLANLPFLWIEPKILACILMGLAILVFAAFPLALARLSLSHPIRVPQPSLDGFRG